MKRLILIAALTLLFSNGTALAADPLLETDVHYQRSPSDLPSQPGVSPQMWLYLEEIKRQDDPALAVRRKAENRADQRMRRIATREWFGISKSRPPASVTPFMGTYSPFWGGNSSDPYRWVGVGYNWSVWAR